MGVKTLRKLCILGTAALMPVMLLGACTAPAAGGGSSSVVQSAVTSAQNATEKPENTAAMAEKESLSW